MAKITLKNRDGEAITLDNMAQASRHMGKHDSYVAQLKSRSIFHDSQGFWWWNVHDDTTIEDSEKRESKCFNCFNYWNCSKSTNEFEIPECVPEDGYEYIDGSYGKSLRITKCHHQTFKHLVNLKALRARAERLTKETRITLED